VVNPDLPLARPTEPAPAESDEALAAALARGDRAALGRLYDRHAPVLLALGHRIVGDRNRAEDVLHDVFLEAWHHAADFDPARGTVRAWLVTRMRSRALDRRGAALRQERLAAQASLQGPPPSSSAVTDAGTATDGLRIHTVISGLPPDLGVVIELGYFEGLSSSETASRLAIPIGTVKSRMARALALLRQNLGDPGGPR
jgi:RNA polymerase sigma-70 factor (ECF subfamily)